MRNHPHPQTTQRVRRFRCALFAVPLLALPAVFAQQGGGAAPPAEGETIQMEKIVVTGTRLTTAEAEGSLSVTPIDIAQPVNAGFPRIGDLLRTKLPQYGGPGVVNEAYANGGDGSSSISLRGLPSSATLLLVNGRRTSTSDLNLIPEAAIDRIEILNDGAGAIYGSDAVAGVVNIILKEEFSGAKFGVYYGNTFKTDISERKITGLIGSVTDKSSFVMSVEWSKSNEQMSVDRIRSRPLPSATSGTSNPGTFYNARNFGTHDGDDEEAGVTNAIPNAVALRWSLVPSRTYGLTNASQIPGGFDPLAWVDTSEAQTTSQALSMRSAAERARNAELPADSPARYGTSPALLPGLNPGFPYGLYTIAYRPHEKYSAYMSGEQKLFGDNLRFFADGYYVHNESVNALAPSPLSGRRVPTANYWLGQVFPDAATDEQLVVGYRPVELGPRITYTEFDAFHTVTGLRGKVADSTFDWELGFLFDRVTINELQTGGVKADEYNRLLSLTTSDAWNPLGYTPIGGSSTVNSAATVNSLGASANTRQVVQTVSVDGRVGGELIDLPGGALSVSLGAEARRESTDYAPDFAIQNGLVFPFNVVAPLQASRNIGSVYAELLVPIVGKDMSIPAITSFSASLALRDEDYSDVGNTGVKPRVSFRWQPVGDQLTVRGSYAQGFIAPGFFDLYQEPGQDFIELNNPVTGLRLQPTEAVLTIGNPGLKPSESDSYLIGFVYAPEPVKGLSVGANYYNIKQDNIPFASAQYVVNQWYAAGPGNVNNPYGANAQPSPENPLGSQVELTPTGDLYQVRNVGPINSGQRKTDGVDILASQEFQTDFGKFTLAGQATRTLTFEQENFPGAGTIDYLGRYWGPGAALADTGFPKWRAVVSLSYEWKRWNAAMSWNYTAGYTEDENGTDFDPDYGSPRQVRDYNTFDLRLGYKIPGIDLDVLFGINNLFDEQPPQVTSTFGDGYDRTLTDLRGRMWFINVSKTF